MDLGFHRRISPPCSAVFDDKALAEEWIRSQSVSGVLTRMPLNLSAYDWATGAGHFVPRWDEQKTPRFIQRFSCASLEHGHYVDGMQG